MVKLVKTNLKSEKGKKNPIAWKLNKIKTVLNIVTIPIIKIW